VRRASFRPHPEEAATDLGFTRGRQYECASRLQPTCVAAVSKGEGGHRAAASSETLSRSLERSREWPEGLRRNSAGLPGGGEFRTKAMRSDGVNIALTRSHQAQDAPSEGFAWRRAASIARLCGRPRRPFPSPSCACVRLAACFCLSAPEGRLGICAWALRGGIGKHPPNRPVRAQSTKRTNFQ